MSPPPTQHPGPPRPLAFIDVDGVLNRDISASVARTRGMVRSRKLLPAGLPFSVRVLIDPHDRDLLTRLGEHFDLAWGTTWEHEAPTLIAPLLGIGRDWPVAVNTTAAASKAPGIRDLAAGRPFVWMDDALTEDDTVHLRGLDCLLIPVASPRVDGSNPETATGLTSEHVETALAWARAHRDTLA